MTEELKQFDHGPITANQGTIIVLLCLSFILNTPWLVSIVAFMMVLGTIVGKPGFGFLYTSLLRPLNIIREDIYPDNPEPHRFAQGFGSIVASASAITIWLGAAGLGWTLTWVVIVLAAANLFLGFCAGCAVYYWLNKLKVPGFNKSAPKGKIPGLSLKGK
ncbi:MAG: DUF4395 domain-containing protein [Chloroflexi bacterium]|nr:DUF4395 domain-containing protein [Chloroflexota bacterium]